MKHCTSLSKLFTKFTSLHVDLQEKIKLFEIILYLKSNLCECAAKYVLVCFNAETLNEDNTITK